MPLQGYVVSFKYFCKRTKRFDEFSVFVLAQILHKGWARKVKEKELAGALYINIWYLNQHQKLTPEKMKALSSEGPIWGNL